MLAVLAQILALASGLLVNLLYPLAFGLAAYGGFLKIALPTLVLHRAVDMANEALIAAPPGKGFFLVSALCVGLTAVLALLALAATGLLEYINLPLFGSLLATSLIMLSLHRDRRFGALVIYLAVFNVAFCTLTAQAATTGRLDLVEVLVLTNLTGAITGLFLLRQRIREPLPQAGMAQTIRQIVHHIPRTFGATLSVNAITNLFPLLVAGTLSATELAKFRIFSSVLQSSASLFPLHTKAVLSLLREKTYRTAVDHWLDLTYWYFLLIVCSLLALATFFPQWTLYGSAALMMIPFAWLILLERYGIASGHSATLGKASLIGLALTLLAGRLWVHDEATAVGAACLLIAAQTGLLCALLLAWGTARRLLGATLLLSALAVLALTQAGPIQSWPPLWAALPAVVYGLVFMRLSRAHLQLIPRRTPA